MIIIVKIIRVVQYEQILYYIYFVFDVHGICDLNCLYVVNMLGKCKVLCYIDMYDEFELSCRTCMYA